MRKVLLAAALVVIVAGVGLLLFKWNADREAAERLLYEREETEVIVSRRANASVQLFAASASFRDAPLPLTFEGTTISLPKGNYFFKVGHSRKTYFVPVPVLGYRSGPDEEGLFVVTLRSPPRDDPPRLHLQSYSYALIPSGHFLLGDRLNPIEPHYVWMTGFFMYPFEVSNEEFRLFLTDPTGYRNDENWSPEGKRWKSRMVSRATALLQTRDGDYERFGRPDQPVVWVNWFEANAFCRWLTKKIGESRWLFSLPSDAEWEKAARGPDNYDYALGMTISDAEVELYNWKKNPHVPVTVVGTHDSQRLFSPNRYGLYHMTGNVAEWSQSTNRLYNRDHPYSNDERNHDGTPGLRSARGGSWYSASIAYLYIPYRDSFQPEHSSQELGFRIIAKPLP